MNDALAVGVGRRSAADLVRFFSAGWAGGIRDLGTAPLTAAVGVGTVARTAELMTGPISVMVQGLSDAAAGALSPSVAGAAPVAPTPSLAVYGNVYGGRQGIRELAREIERAWDRERSRRL